MPIRKQPEDWREIASALGWRVRTLRVDRGMSQERLANIAGVSRNQVQNIEASRNNARRNDGRLAPGPGNPRLDTLFALAEALDVRLVDLLPHQLGGPTDVPERDHGAGSTTAQRWVGG